MSLKYEQDVPIKFDVLRLFFYYYSAMNLYTFFVAVFSPLSSICAAPRGLYLEYLWAGL